MANGAANRRIRPVRPPEDVVERLAWFYRRNGYVRWQNETRMTEDGYKIYKKGHEIRLAGHTLLELAEVRRLLVEAGFKPGNPYTKGSHYRQPMYGKAEVKRFLEMIGEPDES